MAFHVDDDDDNDCYEVGYGKPPKRTQFKSGQSGNPRGRPKRRLDMRSWEHPIFAALQKTFKIKHDGKIKRMPIYKIAIETHIGKMLKGDAKSFKFFADLTNNFESLIKIDKDEASASDHRFIESVKRSADEYLKKNSNSDSQDEIAEPPPPRRRS